MAGLYQPNTDMDALRNVRQAQALSAFGGAWKNKGPFGGIVDIPGTGSGNELFLPVGGIGTAAAVDPSDKTGNTVYLGTHGGLFRSTDGGKHLVNITDGKIMRDGIGSVAVDPTDPKTIYVGTGVALFTLSDDQVGTGVYVSHNRGATFTRPAANTHGARSRGDGSASAVRRPRCLGPEDRTSDERCAHRPGGASARQLGDCHRRSAETSQRGHGRGRLCIREEAVPERHGRCAGQRAVPLDIGRQGGHLQVHAVHIEAHQRARF